MAEKNPAPAAQPDDTTPVTPAAPAKSSTRKWLTPVLAIVAALVVGLFGGVLIGHATAGSSQAAGGNRTGFNGGNFGNREGAQQGAGGAGGAGGFAGAGGGFTSGTIESIDGDTITIKNADGTTTKVTTSSSTTVTKTSKSSVSDLSKGETITVIGQADGSGTVTATTISEGQAGFRGGFGGRGGAGAPSGAPTPGTNG